MAAVLSLWLYDYGASVGPSELVHHVNGYFVAAFAGLVLLWSNPEQESVPVAIEGGKATKAALEQKVSTPEQESVPVAIEGEKAAKAVIEQKVSNPEQEKVALEQKVTEKTA